jgi:hypothetical protein
MKIAACLLGMVMVFAACQESKRESMEREASEYTQQNCPHAEFEDLIFLDSVTCPNDGSNKLTYYYSIHGDSTDMDAIEENHDELFMALLGAVRNSVDLKNVKAEGLDIFCRCR